MNNIIFDKTVEYLATYLHFIEYKWFLLFS